MHGTMTELEALILGFNEKLYLKKLTGFFEKIGAITNPHSSVQTTDLIVDFLHQKSKSGFFQKNKEKFIYKGEMLQ